MPASTSGLLASAAGAEAFGYFCATEMAVLVQVYGSAPLFGVATKSVPLSVWTPVTVRPVQVVASTHAGGVVNGPLVIWVPEES